VSEDGHVLAASVTRGELPFVIANAYHRRLVERMSAEGWALLHGALAEVAGRRLILVGARGAGKTTLALRLLFDGRHVEGDEAVFVRAGEAMALPRPFHLKADTERHVPELLPMLGRLPKGTAADGRPIEAFDPRRAGFDWRLQIGRVDTTIVITPEHGGATQLRRRSPFETVRALLDFSLGRAASNAVEVAAFSRLAEHGGWELRLGHVDSAAALLASMGD
jgi:hypothetical protein